MINYTSVKTMYKPNEMIERKCKNNLNGLIEWNPQINYIKNVNLKCEPNRACESGEMVEMLGRVTGTNIIQMMCIINIILSLP